MSTTLASEGVSPFNQKRSHDEANTDLEPPQSPLSGPASSVLTPLSRTPSLASTLDLAERNRHGSPTRSVTSSAPTSASNANGPPTKKRKLTFAEKEAERAIKKAERDEKEKRKAEDRARKEEEKRVKDEERRRIQEEKEDLKRQKEIEKAEKDEARRLKELEKTEKQKLKDAEKHAKEDKKRKEEEEKKKKERSQMRLSNFFMKSAPSTQPVSAIEDPIATPAASASPAGAGTRRGSDASIPENNQPTETPTKKKTKTDYETYFPEFFLHPNVQLAPENQACRDEQAAEHAISQIDSGMADSSMDVDVNFLAALRTTPYATRRRGRTRTRTMREIIANMNGSVSTPIDLTVESSNQQSTEPINDIPMKLLLFHQDIRPPYRGTYTRKVSPHSARKLSRNPFTRALPNTNYDYDSEAEWEPPQEGDEEILSEEEDESEDGDEDMEGFLDDEDDLGVRRAVIGTNDLQAVSTGLVWENECSSLVVGGVDLNKLKMDVITDDHQFPIDPFSTKYWTPANAPETNKAESSRNQSSTMQPPSRTPLTSAKPNSAVFNQGLLVPVSQTSGEQVVAVKPAQTGQRGRPPKDPTKPLKMISSELLPDFKQAVAGSNLSKAGLIEVLKKQFPKVAKDVIKDTLSSIATREGVKEADKIWVLISN